MTRFPSSNWHSKESRLIRFGGGSASGGAGARGPESFGGGRWPESSDGRRVSPDLARYQYKDAYGRMRIDHERLQKDREEADMRRKSQDFVSTVQRAGARRNEIMQHLVERRDATQGWVRKEYDSLARGLHAAYQEKIQQLQANEWDRYTLVTQLEDVLNQYETKVTDHEEYLKTAGTIYFNRTKAATQQYRTSRRAVFGAEVSRDLTAKVTEAQQALKQAKEDEVTNGVSLFETEVTGKRAETTAKRTEANTAETDAKKAEKTRDDAKKLKDDEAGNDAKLKQLQDDLKELTDTKVPAAETAYNDAVREAKFAGIPDPEKANLIKDLEDKTTAEMEKVRTKAAPYNTPEYNDPAKQKAKIDELKKTFDDQKKLVEAVLEKKKTWGDLKKSKADLEGPAGSIAKLDKEIKTNKATIAKIPALETAATEARKKVKPLEDEAKKLEAELKEMEKKLSELQEPKKTAQKALDDARASLTAARALPRRAPSERQKQEFIGQANATLTAINEEGFHLRFQFEGRTDKMNARLVSLLQQKTDILEDLAEERGLNADRATVRKLLDSIGNEKRYLLQYGSDDVRMTHLNDLESKWAGRMWTIVKKETDDILAKPGASPGEQERIIQQELAFLEEYPQPAGAARIAALNSKDPAVKGELQKAWDRAHKPLFDATEAAVASARANATVPLIQDAIAKVRSEGQFLWERGYDKPRTDILKNALVEMQSFLAKSRVRDAETETAKGVGTGTHVDRMAQVERMQTELATRAETGLEPAKMAELKTKIAAEERTIQGQLLEQGAQVLASTNVDAIEGVIDATVRARRFFRAGRTLESKGREETMVSQLLALRRTLAKVSDDACESAKQRGAQPDVVKTAVDTATREFRILLKYPEFEDYAGDRIGQLRNAMTGILFNVDSEIYNLMDTNTLKPKFVTNAAQAERLQLLIDRDLAARDTLSAVWREARNADWEGKLRGMHANLEKLKTTGGLAKPEEAEATRTVETTLAEITDYVRKFDQQRFTATFNREGWINGLHQVLTVTLVQLEAVGVKPEDRTRVMNMKEDVRQKLWSVRNEAEKLQALQTEKPQLLNELGNAKQRIEATMAARNATGLGAALKDGERIKNEQLGTFNRLGAYPGWADALEVRGSYEALQQQIVNGKRVLDTISPV